jgi:predicted hydrocarbon binding protein/archaellum biogenesis ATPase FlaH
VGSPGTGKTTFCHQVVLSNLVIDKPIIFVTTEYSSFEAEKALKDRGLGNIQPGLLNFIDAYSETVGLPIPDRSDIISTNCANLTNLGIAIIKLQKKIGKLGSLLIIDSLTSPYILNGSSVVRFFKLFLSKFAGEGNSVFACIDEGSGKKEDLVSLMSLSNGIIKINFQDDKKIVNILKHPKIKPTKIELPIVTAPHVISYHFDADYQKRDAEMAMGGSRSTLRPNVGDFINITWRDLVFWSGMLWDPKRFPVIMYDLTKYSNNTANFGIDLVSLLPRHQRFLFRLKMPNNFSKVKSMKQLLKFGEKPTQSYFNAGIIEYLEDKSKTDEHYVRFFESYECWGFDNVGAPLGFMKPAMTVGAITGWEKIKREWNIIETKCIGMGDPYCEYKIVPGEIDELKDSLEKNSTIIEKVNDRLCDYLVGFLLHDKPLIERPTLGSGVHIHELQQVTAAPLVIEQLIMVFRMGGAKAGKMLGEYLTQTGLNEKEAVRRLLNFMNYCKVGNVTFNETIKIRENSERFGMKTKEPSCYFTTGFLNGFLYAIQNQHVKETRCIGSGDPYCEWEFK